MNTFLTADEILQLVTTGVCHLSEDLIVTIAEPAQEDAENCASTL